MPDLKLHFFPGTCARVAMIALEQSGAKFETSLVKFTTGDHRSPEFLRLNPKGKVPVLVIDGKPLTENIAIASWLARTYPKAGVLPISADMAAIDALSDLSWCASSIHPIVTRLVMPQLFCDTPDGVQRAWALASEALQWHARLLETRLASQSWMLAEWSVVDAYVQWIWDQAGEAGFEVSAYPKLNAHRARHLQQPAVQRAMARETLAIDQMRAMGLPVGPPPRPVPAASATTHS
jgi:glutathione S-transferase